MLHRRELPQATRHQRWARAWKLIGYAYYVRCRYA